MRYNKKFVYISIAPFASPSHIHWLCNVVTAATLKRNHVKRHVYSEINRRNRTKYLRKRGKHTIDGRLSVVYSKDSTTGRSRPVGDNDLFDMHFSNHRTSKTMSSRWHRNTSYNTYYIIIIVIIIVTAILNDGVPSSPCVLARRPTKKAGPAIKTGCVWGRSKDRVVIIIFALWWHAVWNARTRFEVAKVQTNAIVSRLTYTGCVYRRKSETFRKHVPNNS